MAKRAKQYKLSTPVKIFIALVAILTIAILITGIQTGALFRAAPGDEPPIEELRRGGKKPPPSVSLIVSPKELVVGDILNLKASINRCEEFSGILKITNGGGISFLREGWSTTEASVDTRGFSAGRYLVEATCVYCEGPTINPCGQTRTIRATETFSIVNCRSSLDCSSSEFCGISGNCQAKLSNGQECGNNDWCKSANCRLAFGTTLLCSQGSKAEGQVCAFNQECASNICRDGRCTAPFVPRCGDGICSASVESAASCADDCEPGTCSGSYDCSIGAGDPTFCSSIGCTPGGLGGQQCLGGTRQCSSIATTKGACRNNAALGCSWVASGAGGSQPVF